MKTKTFLRGLGVALLVIALLFFFWGWGYFAGYGDARAYFEDGVTLPRPEYGLGVLAFAVFGFLLLFVGFLPVRWADEEPTKR